MKRGQITIVVIIGLFILLILGLIFLLKESGSPDNTVSTIVTEEGTKLTQLVQTCLYETTVNGLRLVGRTGGYTDTTIFFESPKVQNTQVVSLGPQKTVIWNEIKECPESTAGCFQSNRPPLCREDSRDCPTEFSNQDTTLQSIQGQLEVYIEENLPDCVENTNQQIPLSSTSSPDVTLIIRENDIVANAEYPLEFQASDGQTQRLRDFSARVPVRLPMMYRFAVEVQEAHAQTAFFEEAFLHLLAIYSGLDQPIPPIKDVALYGTERTWVTKDVQSVIENEILPFMNFMSFFNAEDGPGPVLNQPDIPPEYIPFATGIYEYLFIKTSNTTYPVRANVNYPHTGMYLNINDKQLLRPEKMSGGGFLAKFAGMFFTQYKMKYTTSFPLTISISDDEAIDGKGYTFTFGIETNIYKNYPVKTDIAFYETARSVPITDITNPIQLVNHRYDIKVTDRKTGDGIQDAVVVYECGGRYQMGSTGYAGTWSGQLPYCLTGGSVVVEKFGYLSQGQPQNNFEEDGVTSTIEFSLWPHNEKEIVMFKRTPSHQAQIALQPGDLSLLKDLKSSLSEDEYVLTAVSRVKENLYESDVPLTGAINFGNTKQAPQVNQQEQLDFMLAEGHLTQEEYDLIVAGQQAYEKNHEPMIIESQTVSLVPGTYNFESMLVYKELITIPEEERCSGSGPLEECVTLEAMNFSSWISGGAMLLDQNAVTLDESFVYSDAPLILFVLDQGIPANWDQMEAYQDINEYQTYDRRTMVGPMCGELLC